MTWLNELSKVGAFVRRDLRITMSYRMAVTAGALGLIVQMLMFSFMGKLVDPSRLPMFGGSRATYMEFVAIGITVNFVVVLLLNQLATAIRTEQTIGTLESLLVTPTRMATLQAGSAAYPLLSIPLRMGLFLTLTTLLFGLDLHSGGVLPALAITAAFVPGLWGIGLAVAGAIVTFRRGTGGIALGGLALGLLSGAVFPLSLLPHWLSVVATVNPVAITINGLRATLIGAGGWATAGADVLELMPISAVALAVGAGAFHLALRRERRLGTLGLY